MTSETARKIAEAYRWQRRLGNAHFAASYCHIVSDPSRPHVWDANHIDEVTAQTATEIAAVFAAMDKHLAHASSRVVHTDGFTSDAFLARLALDDFVERPTTIQMALEGDVAKPSGLIDLRAVESDADWAEMLRLVLDDHAEGRRTGKLRVTREITEQIVAGYRAKSDACHFYFAMESERPVAYGAYAAAPNDVGMIEDLYTVPAARRRGVATAMIAAFVDRLRSEGCGTVFLGALAAETAKKLYASLGFRPVGLARAWIKERS